MTSPSHRDFILESREHLNTLEQSLLSLEQARSPTELRDHLDCSLRAIHSLKGDAGFLGFVTLRSLAHAMESLLELYRDAQTAPPTPIVEALLLARDRLAALVEDLDHSQTADISDLLTQLAALEQPGPPPVACDLEFDLSAIARAHGGRLQGFFATLATLGQVTDPQLSPPGALAEGLPAGPVRLTIRLLTHVPRTVVDQTLHGAIEAASFPQLRPIELDLSNRVQAGRSGLVAMFRELSLAGELTGPELEWPAVDFAVQCPGRPLVLRGHFRSAVSPAELSSRLGIVSNEAEPSPAAGIAISSSSADPSREAAPAGPSSPTHAPSTGQAGRSLDRGPSADAERLASLRVNVELLDRMMTLVGELTLVRNQSLLAFAEVEGTPRAIIQRLNSVTSELQETVLRTRMQPVANLFGKFPRMVRDLARHLGKQVDIVTIGQEVELDKTVLEQLSDPLTHLLRNSIDHGIELPADRVARGKPATGVITLSATPADGQVLIEIQDDGRGIDPAAVKARALTQRLKTPAELERMSPRELNALILLPGFSTASQVTEVSGRGVGMDVVRTNVEQLEGALTIDSTPGEGTSMVLRVPLTLAIIPCLIVVVRGERYAIPQRELEEIVCLHPGGKGAIEQGVDDEVYRLRDRLLPIVRFREVLARPGRFHRETRHEILRQHPPAERDPATIEYILVLRSQGRRFGLLVDQVRGTQEVVVKPMHPAMKRLGIFSGATLMGDGQVALIANVDGIAEHSDCFGSDLRASVGEVTTVARDPREVHRVLIFESGPQEQFALPLVQIRRLELLTSQRIERVGDAEFVTLDGVATRIVRLDSVLNVSAMPPRETMYLILPKFVPEPMGILISRIIDTDSLAMDLQPANLNDHGILGTAIVRGRMSLFLDVQFLRERVFGPSVEQSSSREASRPGTVGRRVLLIDDTPFFREIVRRYLEAEGIEVTTAVDGQDGLAKLAAGTFDLVVCDIEMPNLDGWGFAQCARERGCRTPLLALTSLSKTEHEARALAGGFSEFQEKLDHDRLLRTVHRLLAESPRQLLAGGRS